MSQDIGRLLDEWEFDPHELNVRLVVDDQGRRRLQMRLELGILQMHLEGRPDGAHPEDFESLLDLHEHLAQRQGDDYRLTPEMLEALYREGQQYYQRYLALFQLEWFEPVVRDTERNLRLFAFIRGHARRKRDQWRFDQFRPYVLMMRARARAMLALQLRDRDLALAVLAKGAEEIKAFLADYNRSPADTESFELDFLGRMADELAKQDDDSPIALSAAGQLAQLRDDLDKAVEQEDYERAALIRDRINKLDPARRHDSR